MIALEPNSRFGPRAKIERAREHLAEFDRELNTFIADSPYTIRVHTDPDQTQHVILESQKPIPIRWSTIVGDVIHNARSALDLLVTYLASLETKVVENLGFPIRRHRADFEKNALNKFGQNCPRTVRFLQRLKIYERGGDPGHHANTLVLLHRLSIRDKHRLIVPVGTAAAYAEVIPAPGFGEPFKLAPPEMRPLTTGETIITLSPKDPLFANKKFETKLTTQIRLSDVEGLPPVGASPLLHHVVKVVDRIVGIAERKLF
jgi:hypothetical protein